MQNPDFGAFQSQSDEANVELDNPIMLARLDHMLTVHLVHEKSTTPINYGFSLV